MGTIRAGALYFAIVFGAGFVFGIVRQLVLIPRLGVMWAELAEMPLMLAVIVWAARWVVGRPGAPAGVGARAGIGLIALALLVCAELGLVLQLRGMSLAEYVAQREPVSGVVYLAMLAVFAAMPWLAGLGQAAGAPGDQRGAAEGRTGFGQQSAGQKS